MKLMISEICIICGQVILFIFAWIFLNVSERKGSSLAVGHKMRSGYISVPHHKRREVGLGRIKVDSVMLVLLLPFGSLLATEGEIPPAKVVVNSLKERVDIYLVNTSSDDFDPGRSISLYGSSRGINFYFYIDGKLCEECVYQDDEESPYTMPSRKEVRVIRPMEVRGVSIDIDGLAKTYNLEKGRCYSFFVRLLVAQSSGVNKEILPRSEVNKICIGS